MLLIPSASWLPAAVAALAALPVSGSSSCLSMPLSASLPRLHLQIKELEDELQRSRQREDRLIGEVRLKQEQVAALQQDLAGARCGDGSRGVDVMFGRWFDPTLTLHRSASLSRAQMVGRTELAELERLLEEELSKTLAVEGQLQATQVSGEVEACGA